MWGLAVNQLPMVGATVLWLVFLEGLLSADNALVLAMMVRHLPRSQQKRALRYGIWGAFAFRMVAVLLANLLLSLWYLKVLGGAYLLYLAAAHVIARNRGDGDTAAHRVEKGFWWTVVLVELADIAFSIDSILAAVAMAEEMNGLSKNEKFLIVVTGGILGIITMRFVAGYFITLLERFRGLEGGAYALVAWIGLKLVASGLHSGHYLRYTMGERVFWAGMLLIVVVSFLYKPARKPPPSADERAMIGEVTRIASGDPDAQSG